MQRQTFWRCFCGLRMWNERLSGDIWSGIAGAAMDKKCLRCVELKGEIVKVFEETHESFNLMIFVIPVEVVVNKLFDAI